MHFAAFFIFSYFLGKKLIDVDYEVLMLMITNK